VEAQASVARSVMVEERRDRTLFSP
jgi:hypothetical protein